MLRSWLASTGALLQLLACSQPTALPQAASVAQTTPAGASSGVPRPSPKPVEPCVEVGSRRLDPERPLGLRCVRGQLSLLLSSAQDATVLRGVTRVEGDLVLDTNPALTSLTGLEELTEVTGSLLIHENASLLTLAGLGELRHIGGNLSLMDNRGLTSLAALGSLAHLGGSLNLSVNDSLTDLSGLQRIERLHSLVIHGSGSLTSLRGLEAVTTVEGELYIKGNRVLTSLDGLSSLRKIGGRLFIRNNPALASLDGLQSLTEISRQPTFNGLLVDFTAEDNPRLPSCAIDRFAIRYGAHCKCSGNDDSAVCN